MWEPTKVRDEAFDLERKKHFSGTGGKQATRKGLEMML